MYKNILLCSIYPDFILEIQDLISDLDYNLTQVEHIKELGTLDIQYKPSVVLIEASDNRNEIIATYDAIYNKYRNAKIIVVFKNTLAFDIEQLGGRKQNLTFLQRPFEDELLINYLMEHAPIEIPQDKMRIEHLNPIRISDIRPSDKFNFDLYFYMPANKKILLYRRKNSSLSEDQISKFKKFHVYDLYVRKNEMHAVYTYLSHKLRRTFGDKSLPVTEKRRLLQKEVRDMFGMFFDSREFDFQKSRVVLDTCKQVVGKFLTEISPHPEIYTQVLSYTAQLGSNFNHANNVSVFATLFGLGLGVEDIEPLAIGSMLHDIGLSSLPVELTKKTYEEMEDKEKNIYHQHVNLGLKLIEKKKIAGVDTVKKLIEQHHERMDSAGYPNRIPKSQIELITRICQIADELDELTCIKPGQTLKTAPLSPIAALDKMISTNSDNHGPERFDPELLFKIKKLVTPPSEFKLNEEKIREILGAPVKMPPNPEAIDLKDLKRRKRYKKAV